MNCSLWSAEVFEDDGSLMHVHSAVTRGRLMVRLNELPGHVQFTHVRSVSRSA